MQLPRGWDAGAMCALMTRFLVVHCASRLLPLPALFVRCVPCPVVVVGLEAPVATRRPSRGQLWCLVRAGRGPSLVKWQPHLRDGLERTGLGVSMLEYARIQEGASWSCLSPDLFLEGKSSRIWTGLELMHPPSLPTGKLKLHPSCLES
ncbi:hypothetical protein B0T24DRAFT_173688 [Lasiosphaeria ovina]|uniref:Secreted protein n=1 Tax=Lasiosphaeria ovina TaxID=92902 RepID=A0AAE0TT76_9PEZI|nr:hypothetical protein B0T24DRAFT_173688 [Lasiosphaeria ovina]